MHLFSRPHVPHAPPISSGFDQRSNIWSAVHTMKLLIMHSPPVTCYLVTLSPKNKKLSVPRFISQIFMKNLYTKFHENLTKGLVADTRSQKDRWTYGRGVLIRRSFLTSEVRLRKKKSIYKDPSLQFPLLSPTSVNSIYF
jgi:hypothetical protein